MLVVSLRSRRPHLPEIDDLSYVSFVHARLHFGWTPSLFRTRLVDDRSLDTSEVSLGQETVIAPIDKHLNNNESDGQAPCHLSEEFTQ